MKLRKNEKYFYIAAYAVLSCLIVLGGIFVLLNFRLVWQWIKNMVSLIFVLIEPLLVGLVLAYLLDPIVIFYDKRWQIMKHTKKFHWPWHFQCKKKKRWHTRTVPTLLTFITLACVLGLFGIMIQMNIEQVSGSFSIIELRKSVDGYLEYFEDMIGGISEFTTQMGIMKGKGLIERLYERVNQFVLFLYYEWSTRLMGLGLHAMNGLLGVVVAFYLLQDKHRFMGFFKRFLRLSMNQEHYKKLTQFGKATDEILSGYIRGEVIDAAIIVILTSGALLAIQLDFAIIIGIISGIFNLIPYFGPIVGFVLAVIIGLLDANPMKAFYAAIAIFVIQQIDGWFIVPKVVGDCVKLHPVVVLLAILIGGNLFGLIGMLLAVPVAALIRLLLGYLKPQLFKRIDE